MNQRAELSAGGGDRGETLIELLITIAIMGIAVVAILGAVLTAVGASSLHRSQVTAVNDLRSAAETLSRTAATGYTPCATSAQVATGLPPGGGVTVAGVRYWNGSAFGSSCSAGSDQGLQQVTLQVTLASQFGPSYAQTLAVVVRKPCTSSC